MSEDLPKFNENAKCAKCMSDDINTYFCDKPRFYKPCGDANRARGYSIGEHLHRQCRRCHYEWIEECCDA